MGQNISNNIPSESTHQIHSQKLMHNPGDGLDQSCSKNCEILDFWQIFFVFANMGPYGSKSFTTTSPLKEHIRFACQNSWILLGRVSSKVVQRIVEFEILYFWQFFFFFFFARLTW